MLATILVALVVGALAGVTGTFVVLELVIRAAARQPPPDQTAAGGGPSRTTRPHARGRR